MTATYIMVDVEADGPIPGEYSMIALGAVVVEPPPQRTFYEALFPISTQWIPEALAVSGVTREETLKGMPPKIAMLNFRAWLSSVTDKPMFISDNNGFDFAFVNWYFWTYLQANPFGHSSTNLGSLYKGLVQNLKRNFKHLRKTKHTHNPVDDAMGNVEALLELNRQYRLQILPRAVGK